MHWGDRYLAPDGPPLVVEHATCGGAVVEQLVCSGCGKELGSHEIQSRLGPGARPQATAA